MSDDKPTADKSVYDGPCCWCTGCLGAGSKPRHDPPYMEHGWWKVRISVDYTEANKKIAAQNARSEKKGQSDV